MSELQSFNALADLARKQPPLLALVLGSGLSELARRLEHSCHLSFADIPGLSAATVTGHAGLLALGNWAGKRILLFQGRLHFYEGHPWETVTLPARIAHDLGARIFLTTNASGGIRDDLVPGSLLGLTGQIDWTRPRYCSGPAQSNQYSARLRALLDRAARAAAISLLSGVYAQVTGPCYETPAEIRALRSLGADAVGMSTAREIEAAHELGLECAGLSCIANRAAGLSPGPIHHDEVLAGMAAMVNRLGGLLEEFLRLI